MLSFSIAANPLALHTFCLLNSGNMLFYSSSSSVCSLLQVLHFDADQLRQNLKFCSPAWPAIIDHDKFDDFDQAKELVKELWPDCPSPLERAEEPTQ